MELNESDAKLTALENEIAILKRREIFSRRLQIVGLVVIGYMALTASKGTTQAVPQDLTCRSLQIVDGQGQRRATVGVNDGGGFVALRGTNGVEQLFCGVNQAGGAIGLRAASGREQLFGGINESGGHISIYGVDRREKVFVGITGGGNSGVVEMNRGNIR